MTGGRGALVVVAGIPGAGKTTALREVAGEGSPPDLLVVDSDSVRRGLQARLPGVPYRVFRPVVHTVHWCRVAVLAFAVGGPLLVHETATRRASRAVLLRIARLADRPARLVWLDVDAATAWRGQVVRDRVIRSGSFHRHVRRVECLDPATGAGPGWDSVCRTDREHCVAAISRAARLTAPAGHR